MKIQLFALILFLSSTLEAQRVAFRDDFRDNRNQWSIEAREEYASYLSGGHYYISKKTESGGRLFYKDIYTEYDHDYDLEVEIRQVSGVDNNGYGLLFATSSGQEANFFVVSSNGYYRVAGYKAGKYVSDMEWKKSDFVSGMNEVNSLNVTRKGDEILFAINTHVVHKIDASDLDIRGPKVGFILFNEMKIKVDYLQVRQEYRDIRLVPGADTVQLVKENMGDAINSPYVEKTPVISADGKTLYFVREDHPQNIGSGEMADVWYSRRIDGVWQPAQNIGAPINNDSHNFVISVTPDNNALLVGNTYHSDGSSAGAGFSYATRQHNSWSVPKKVSVENYYNDNDYTESCLSSSRKVLLSTVERKDTRGSKDIYVSFLQEDSTWSEHVNIGDVINTPASEASPFLAADDQTLYFSTSGHPGFGSNDIFMTRRLDDTWLNWSEPLNLGPQINTPNWDAYYTMPASGDYAYVVSESYYEGDLDLFKIKLPQAAKPKAVTLVYGKVLNAKTNEALAAEIRYADLETDRELGRATSLAADGSYQIVLSSGKSYAFLASKDNYVTVSENLSIAEADTYQEVERNLYLAPIEVGQTVLINNIFFDFGKATLREASHADLNRLVALLEKYPQMQIEISGHTDNVGSEASNQLLSQNRAAAVVSYLASRKVAAQRLKAVGYGEANPVAENETDEGRQRNRRVEFTITSM
ncbi:OmpA family protein [Marinoscillum furvescens]|uniref:Outer membrane protein OmpA-like peptidoglycan-associated protein n=1 Tax=Marinoscillum furvescens DSM 4134 TaxID=1122208 RepID=A0A3D9L0Q3_MARFU|nr:OmpA family protein [Marinoscillum furvescens]RED96603.1 outer membrane protein OmpA-like peptidoglycan-associated protein [Marinoscillum furvescens DSM 4134]